MANPTPGQCRYCECTDAHPCARDCFWIDAERTVCSAEACFTKYFGERAEAARYLFTLLQRELMGRVG